MNYIQHLNSAFLQFNKDPRLNPTHISLYMALFQYWNINRFPEVFHIHRDEIMHMAKIGSKATYHRCLRELDSSKYILYLPSHNPYKGSKIKMLIFGTSGEQVVNKHRTSDEQALVSNTNTNKQIINLNKLSLESLPKNEFEVIEYFAQKKWSESEAMKFFNHYVGVGWKIGGKVQITNWRAIADNWLLKAKEIKKEKISKIVPLKRDHLMTVNQKNYGKPL
ncbi:hypothetical protein K8352_14880 [Flavobacteriaceae bacterium F89]|uniref:Uncharacterized protein n=1 Tax=Cerina litoralis TaxID=2874477 RepID=A0AAE3EVY3_9FLAO|nr:hypothetical protein [Cerina litoralis]MCG2462042.1 hypothetical protein [Cerina litoralis]